MIEPADLIEAIDSPWYGRMLVVKSDREMSEAVRRGLLWERALVSAFGEVLAPGEAAIDIGANIGCHTLALADLVGAAGAVVAYEPQPFLTRLLESNTRDAAAEIVVRPIALGAEAATHTVSFPDYASAANPGGWSPAVGDRTEKKPRVPLEETARSVSVERLDDDLPDRVGSRRVGLIKVDVEGMEVDVLRGAAGVIAEHRPALFIETREHRDDIDRLLAPLGYGPLQRVDTPAGADFVAMPEGAAWPSGLPA
jgi:FkbM family methyltransferase